MNLLEANCRWRFLKPQCPRDVFNGPFIAEQHVPAIHFLVISGTMSRPSFVLRSFLSLAMGLLDLAENSFLSSGAEGQSLH
jgi:hypothetical protein